MKQYDYSDGLEHITMLNGMVRLDWFNYTGEPAPKPAAEQGAAAPPALPPREVARQLVLPAGGFLQAYEAMKRFVGQLEAQGVIAHAPQGGAAEDEKHQPAAGSPNFE